MPSNDNIVAQIAPVPLAAALPDPPPLEDKRLAAWLFELRQNVDENSDTVNRSLGALKTSVTEPTTLITASSYNITDEDAIILADATAAPITLTLPPAADVLYQVFAIKRLNSGANSVTIDGLGSETIDGALTKVLSSQYDTLNIVSDGTEWWISQLAGAGGTDADAIHDNVASEISAITNKATPADGDFILIEDSAAGNAKKHILVSSISGSGSADLLLNSGPPAHDTVSGATLILIAGPP